MTIRELLDKLEDNVDVEILKLQESEAAMSIIEIKSYSYPYLRDCLLDKKVTKWTVNYIGSRSVIYIYYGGE